MNHEQAADALRALVDRYRAQCLWFLRDDYYPETPEDVLRVFRLIEEHGDLEALRMVSELRAWFSHRSSTPSASF